ncbi:MAG: OmpH family outer membrane protein [Pseudomonadota bacterium]
MRWAVACLAPLGLASALQGQGALGPSADLPLQLGETVGIPQSPILTIDQDRLFSLSDFGRRVQADLLEASRELAEENRAIENELAAEELQLTEQRKTLEPEQFRALADAFDEKVTELRRQQDGKTMALQRQRDQARADFINTALPVLTEIVEEAGAVAIIDKNSVFLTVNKIDITDSAIERLNRVVGDGASEQQENAPSTPPLVDDGTTNE